MKQVFYRGRFIFIPLAVAAFLSLISFVVMQLWNCLLPGILHVTVITFWQAMGIFILCKILFGFGKGGRGFGGRDGGPWMRHKMEEKFKHMSPEQREKFKQKMGDRMCHWRDRNPGMRHPFDREWDVEQDKQEGTAEPKE
ncbi:hypothetical protein HQ865_22040 [Mucilaginibacter mali]|uniref:DUF1682 domain-containing protein n=1 Tax=Mucilaginibacter mali TaxID=2740462 RepID=A0A7D4QCI2_9SPHI|nr:hypothetical protein [Mucilaginibacter mali]QKJ32325.1 hypothetical protein HQ865_22040 [Mucilaginibacter mali]